MTLQELRYVVALADHGHFGRAAEACFVSQSTLSTGLKKLEDYLGITLFDRSLRRVTPTPIGREIIDSARLILQEAERIKELARLSRDPMDRTVQLGVIPTLGPYYLPHALTMVHKLHPKLRLLLREELTPHLLQDLDAGRLDGALLALPVEDPGLEVAPLFVEPFLAALPANHPLARKKAVALPELAAAGLLLLEEGHCLREQALEACQLEGLKNEEIRATSLETLRQMVGLGLGVTLMPLLAGAGPKPTRGQVVLRPLAGEGAARTIGLVWRRRSAAAQTLTQLARTLGDYLPAGVRPASVRDGASSSAEVRRVAAGEENRLS
ncbi:MAG: LysR substrate-binding domain-containing protein [Thiobacillaceae bacterium]|nr:LysR substrate-binding domain-containing protein [Thiobacillaceae bacterium]MCX7672610.1 LysR substrate-binding domain-containing protein [Thiobacillaceae bacterium]